MAAERQLRLPLHLDNNEDVVHDTIDMKRATARATIRKEQRIWRSVFNTDSFMREEESERDTGVPSIYMRWNV